MYMYTAYSEEGVQPDSASKRHNFNFPCCHMLEDGPIMNIVHMITKPWSNKVSHIHGHSK